MATDRQPPDASTDERLEARRRQHRRRRRHLQAVPLTPDGLSPQRIPRKRWAVLLFILGLLGLVMVGNLLRLHLIEAPKLREKARSERAQANILQRRGRLMDRNGIVLAQDAVVYDFYVHPPYFKEQSPQQIAEALAPVLQRPVGELVHELSRNLTTITIARNLPLETVEQLQALRTPVVARHPKTHEPLRDEATGELIVRQKRLNGLDFHRKARRVYPQGHLAAHVVGFTHDEAQVATGMEKAAQALLQQPLQRQAEESPSKPSLPHPSALVTSTSKLAGMAAPVLDGQGKPVSYALQDLLQLIEGSAFQDVRLTLDARLQHIAETALRKGVTDNKADGGCVIMMDPRNGEVLAFAALPDFEPQRFYQASYRQLKNWAITDVYPPGSTMKILTVAYGLESGVIQPFSRILDTGRMKVGGWTISNYDYYKHPNPGWVDLTYLFLHSSNVASAKIAIDIPASRYEALLRESGFGRKTGIELPGESAGLMHSHQDWDVATKATLGYGYGLGATPLQMAAAISALANGGIWHAPHLLPRPAAVTAPVVQQAAPPNSPAEKKQLAKAGTSATSSVDGLVPSHRLFTEATAKTVTQLLWQSIVQNKTHPANIEGLPVAGKTGTSRKPNPDGRGYSPDLYTSFVGYFPVQAPRLLVLVVVDSPRRAEAWGSTVAAPIFREIALESAHYLGLLNQLPDSLTREKQAEKAPVTGNQA